MRFSLFVSDRDSAAENIQPTIEPRDRRQTDTPQYPLRRKHHFPIVGEQPNPLRDVVTSLTEVAPIHCCHRRSSGSEPTTGTPAFLDILSLLLDALQQHISAIRPFAVGRNIGAKDNGCFAPAAAKISGRSPWLRGQIDCAICLNRCLRLHHRRCAYVGSRYRSPYLALPSAVVQPAARGKSTSMESERCTRKKEPKNGHFGRSSAA